MIPNRNSVARGRKKGKREDATRRGGRGNDRDDGSEDSKKKEVKLSLRTARAGPERGGAPGGRVTKQGAAEKSHPNSIIGGAAVIA